MKKPKKKKSIIPTARCETCCGNLPNIRQDKRTGDTVVFCETCGLSVELFGEDRAIRLFNTKVRIRARMYMGGR